MPKSPIEELHQGMLQAAASQRAAAIQEFRAMVLQARDGSQSRRKLLGLDQENRRQTKTPLFDTKSLFEG